MKTESVFFTESISDKSFIQSDLWEFNLRAVKYPESDDGDDEDDNDSDGDTEEKEKYKGDDSSGDDDPPLDKDVVHSPVTTLPGGVPKKS